MTIGRIVNYGGFWRPGRYLVLEQYFDFHEDGVWLDLYIVMDDDRATVSRHSFYDYTLQSIGKVLGKASFYIMHVWNNLTGTFDEESGDWIAVVCGEK